MCIIFLNCFYNIQLFFKKSLINQSNPFFLSDISLFLVLLDKEIYMCMNEISNRVY